MHYIKGLGLTFIILIIIAFAIITLYASYLLGIGLFIILVVFVLSWAFKTLDKPTT